MSKFMKFWLLIICFLFIFLIIFTDRVNALNYDYSVGTERFFMNDNINKSYILQSTTSTNTTLSDNITFDTPITPTNANFIRFVYSGAQLTSSVYNNNINLILTCAGYNGVSSGTTGYTIYYQDGSTASMSGTTRDIICTSYTTNQTTITILNYDISNVAFQIFLKTNASGEQWQQCEMENGFILCPVKNNVAYNGLYIGYRTLSSSVIGGTTYNFRIYRSVNEIKTSTQTIIDNNNQNAQQQHNDAQQQYNFISNTTISNQNYTDAQNISDSNTNIQTKSVVMNFWLIPLNFFNSIIASFENTCTQVCVGECGSGHDNAWRFVFPCLDIKGFVGNTIYNTIDAFFAIGMIFAFVKRAKNFFINALMLTNDVASEVSVF